MNLILIKSNVAKAILVLVLLICFGIQVWDGLFKFVKRQTTIAATTEYLREAELPVLSFCPGYKYDDKDYYDQVEALGDLLDNDEGKLHYVFTIKHT